MSSPPNNSTSSLNMDDEMYVTKRSGKPEIVSFDKILNRNINFTFKDSKYLNIEIYIKFSKIFSFSLHNVI